MDPRPITRKEARVFQSPSLKVVKMSANSRPMPSAAFLKKRPIARKKRAIARGIAAKKLVSR